MTSLLSLHALSKSFGTETLFKELSFTISERDKIGLLGPNGAGKSTLLKILIDIEKADSGFVAKKQGLKIGYASQSPEFSDETLENILIKEIPNGDPVEVLTKCRTLLGKAQFTNFNEIASKLSGGWKKRLDIARALMRDPDLLLLDEPTNHLDLEGILWLEKFLNREKIAFVVVSHDRYFLENVSNKIIEINKCYKTGLFISEGSMETYHKRKEEFIENQLQYQKGLASEVRDEIAWLRRSPKARTTKSRSRIDRAHELISELSDVKTRNKVHKVDLEFSSSDRETRKLLQAKNISKSMGDKKLFSGLDLILSPGTRLGIVGKNGTGKTTLLKILSGAIPSEGGTIKYADDLKLVYFDQHRETISDDVSLRRALSPNSDTVNYRGQLIHVNGWAKKFLFHQDRLEMPVKYLSGGERARILIAKLMLEPADILFLDEPTNDLDIDTLQVIEDSLKEFKGAVVLISHDRCLMDNICTKLIGLGLKSGEYHFADYSQWQEAVDRDEKENPLKQKPKPEVKKVIPPVKKLSYHEQKELDGMEDAIIKAEKSILLLQNQLENPAQHQDAKKSLELYTALAEEEKRLENLFIRWDELLKKTK